jgi:hypothetical protein
VRATWLWLKDNNLRWPWQPIGYRRDRLPEITWVEPTYHAVHTTLTHPAYAGAYVYGRTRLDRYVADNGQLRVRRRTLPRDEWEVLITDHHRGFIDWDTYQANQARIDQNIRPERSQPGTGAVREGACAVPKLATSVTCGFGSPGDHEMITGRVVPAAVSDHDQAVQLARSTRPQRGD